MGRSLRVRIECIEKVKFAVKRNGFITQRALAEELGIALSTASNFLNGKPVDVENFQNICLKLALDWREIADLSVPSKELELPFDKDYFYVERVPYESQCYEVILQPGALLRIKAPHQMGKTLLMQMLLAQVENQGYRTLSVSFDLVADSTVFTDISKFLQCFCVSVGDSLELPNRLTDYWDDMRRVSAS
jgi:serine/threonine-protein kinase